MINFQNVSYGTAENWSKFVLEVLSKYDLEEKVVAFYGDNCNSCLIGVARQGFNNVFSELKSVLDIDVAEM